jgi:hypothetical protein
MTRFYMRAAAMATLLGAGQVFAYEPLADGTTTEERANTARLNAEQAARAEAEIAAYRLSIDQTAREVAKEQQLFIDKTEAYESEKQRVSDQSAAERMAWEADVIACRSGDTTRCALPQTDPQ